MNICSKCKKKKEILDFKKNDIVLKTCFSCRNQSKTRKKNKIQISLYNKFYNEKKLNNQKVEYVYAKKVNDPNEEWIKFETQKDAAKILKLYPPNINKVLKGNLKTTGGYIFKLDKEVYISQDKKWEDIKKENGIEEKCKGKPSQHRIIHENRDGIIGKKCCHCKEWKDLNNYNISKKHWDSLRIDCKNCLSQYRKDNREKISEKIYAYEKKRKEIDPTFKLLKTLRSRLGNVLKRKGIEKTVNTIELLGCTIDFLKGFIEAKFKNGMNWENHGDWHIDHIRPCASFNLTNEEDVKKCFHYTNLQPLWAKENLIKGSKYGTQI